MSKTLSVVKIVEEQLDRMPQNVKRVGKTLDAWKKMTTRSTRRSPAKTILGALVVGWVFSKLTRIFT